MSKDKTENKSTQTGAEQKESRRKVLKSTLLGGTVISTSVLQEQWTKPVLNAVITPSHAETSIGGGGDGGAGGTPTTTAAPTTAAPTTTTTTTAAPTTTTMGPNANANMSFGFTFSDWEDLVS